MNNPKDDSWSKRDIFLLTYSILVITLTLSFILTIIL
jgi:hypothetical protein